MHLMCSQPKFTAPTARVIAELCHQKFEELPKTGKPTANQWTVLAAIVQFDNETKSSQVVSLGTGTKCIGRSKLCSRGFILNDSHAEVLARRGFLRYLYHQLLVAITASIPGKDKCIFSWNEELNCFVINDQLEFHFYCTQTPCGDACIENEPYECVASSPKRKRLETKAESDHDMGLPLASSPAVYTGAKLIDPDGTQSDHMIQTPSALRTKPGRGERTLSMSCSDKMSRWNLLGVQGALLDILIDKPIYFKSLNFSCPEARLSNLERAIFKRWTSRDFSSQRFQPQQPLIRIDSTSSFKYAQRPDWQPSPSGIVWIYMPDSLRFYEISVNGKRQGVTKKNLNSPQSAMCISKYHLFNNFLELLQCSQSIRDKLKIQLSDLDNLTYERAKNLSTRYQEAWQSLKSDYFQLWTSKSKDLLQFTIQIKQYYDSD